jgi:F0F1-type ATP synthase delta subunit
LDDVVEKALPKKKITRTEVVDGDINGGLAVEVGRWPVPHVR